MTPPLIQDSYKLVFEDRFRSDTGLWVNQPWYNRPPKGSIQFDNGLHLTLQTAIAADIRVQLCSLGPDRGVQSRPRRYSKIKDFEQGYFEARIRYTDNSWAHPAFWLFASGRPQSHPVHPCHSGGPGQAEWDIMENIRANRDEFESVLHENTNAECGVADRVRSNRVRLGSNVNLSRWHTYGGLWVGDELTNYVDDVKVGNSIQAFATLAQPMYLIVSINKRPSVTDGSELPDVLEMWVDWVRVWQIPNRVPNPWAAARSMFVDPL